MLGLSAGLLTAFAAWFEVVCVFCCCCLFICFPGKIKVPPVEECLCCEGQIKQPQNMARDTSGAGRAEGRKQERGMVFASTVLQTSSPEPWDTHPAVG